MRDVQHEKLLPGGGFGAAQSRTAQRVGLATQEQRPEGALSVGRRLKLYTVGRWSQLAKEANIGDRLDDEFRVESINADSNGRIVLTCIQE